MSAVPCVHSTGGFGDSETIPDQSQYLPDSAFSSPRVPGAMPGQLADGTESPGYPPSPTCVFSTSSTSTSSRSGGSRCPAAQYAAFRTFRGENGVSADRSPARSRSTKSGAAVPPPDPA